MDTWINLDLDTVSRNWDDDEVENEMPVAYKTPALEVKRYPNNWSVQGSEKTGMTKYYLNNIKQISNTERMRNSAIQKALIFLKIFSGPKTPTKPTTRFNPNI
jgi:hypothetical protein